MLHCFHRSLCNFNDGYHLADVIKRTKMISSSFLIIIFSKRLDKTGTLGYNIISQYGEVPKGSRGQFAKLLGRATGARVRSSSSPPKNSTSRNLSNFFIQAAGLAYHRRTTCGAYHQGRRAALVSHHASACISLRLDDIQCFALMIYRNKLWMYALIY